MNAPAPPASLDFLDLSYRPDLRTLTVRWLRPVSLAELQEGFRAALALHARHRTGRWLVDVRRRTELDAPSSLWVAQELLPQAADLQRPGTLHVAYLLSPLRAEQLVQRPDLRHAVDTAQAPAQPYRLVTFTDEGPAVRWLLEQPAV